MLKCLWDTVTNKTITTFQLTIKYYYLPGFMCYIAFSNHLFTLPYIRSAQLPACLLFRKMTVDTKIKLLYYDIVISKMSIFTTFYHFYDSIFIIYSYYLLLWIIRDTIFLFIENLSLLFRKLNFDFFIPQNGQSKYFNF